MGRMLHHAREPGEIRFDMSPFTRRDFIPVETAGRAIAALLQTPPGGIVNVGSGIALECGRLALWLLEGFGRGRLSARAGRSATPSCSPWTGFDGSRAWL